MMKKKTLQQCSLAWSQSQGSRFVWVKVMLPLLAFNLSNFILKGEYWYMKKQHSSPPKPE